MLIFQSQLMYILILSCIQSNTELWVDHISVLLFLSAHKCDPLNWWPRREFFSTFISLFKIKNQKMVNKNTMPLEVSNIQASTSKSTACRRHSQCHGSQISAFCSGNPEFHTILRPVNCHPILWLGNRHTVLEPANCHVLEPANCHSVSEPGKRHPVLEPGKCHPISEPGIRHPVLGTGIRPQFSEPGSCL